MLSFRNWLMSDGMANRLKLFDRGVRNRNGLANRLEITLVILNRQKRIMLALFNNHIWEVKAILNRLSKLLLIWLLTLAFLKVLISLDTLPYDPHIRVDLGVESPDEMSHVFVLLPAFDSFEQTQIHNDGCWAPRDARGAVYINIQAQVIDHVVEVLSCEE